MLIILIVLISYGPGKQSRCSSVNSGDNSGFQDYEICVWRFLWKCSLIRIMIGQIYGDILPGQYFKSWLWSLWFSLILVIFSVICIDLSNIFFDFLLNFFDSPKAVVEQLGQYFMSWLCRLCCCSPPSRPPRPLGLKTMRHCGESEIRNPI